MPKCLNKVQLMGMVGKDATEYRTQGSDRSIVRFSLATNERYKNRAGEQVEEVHWHNVVSFNKFINQIALDQAHKGTFVYVEGEVKYREYEKDGVKKFTTEIVIPPFGGAFIRLILSKADKAEMDAATTTATPPVPAAGGGDFDDDVPF